MKAININAWEIENNDGETLVFMTPEEFEFIQKYKEKADKEIERLKEELQIEKETNKELLSTGADLENKLYEEQDKNKRLNNIINELEKEFEELKNLNYSEDKIYAQGIHDTIITHKYKIQELKGSDKE